MKKKTGFMTSMTLITTGIVFVLLTVTMILSNTLTFFFIRQGWITFHPGEPPVPMLLQNAFTSIVIGTVLTFFVVHLPLRPIQTLTQAIREVAKGNFQTKIYIEHPKEFRDLSKSFNQMTDELAGIELLRSDFINNFSHEFKSPIVSISGFARLMKGGNLTEAEKQEYLDIIISESARLSELSTNVLNLSKVESMTLLSDFTHYNLSEQIRQCVVLLEAKWTQKNITFHLEDMEELFLIGNEALLTQVWTNLIDNAVKFSPENSEIMISLAREGSSVRAVIRDQGSGIASEKQKYIFDKFYQADISHSVAGNGLGLSLVARILELHRGNITVDSAPGRGSAFTVTLPLSQFS